MVKDGRVSYNTDIDIIRYPRHTDGQQIVGIKLLHAHAHCVYTVFAK